MQGTNRSSQSTAWVGESLAKLGQQVGASLAEREQQKQAQEMLPFLQQSMQESMKLAQDGDTAGAYSNMMGIFAANPNLMNNPRALPFFELGLNGIKESALRYKQDQDYNQRQAYYNKVTANKTGGGDGVDPQSFLDTINGGDGGVVEVDETINPEGIDPVVAGRMPGFQIPTEGIQTQRGMGMTPRGITAQATAAGLPATEPTTPTAPGVSAIKGVTPENALFPDLQKESPPKNVLERFIKFEERFAALPFEKQKAEMDNNSILFPNKEMLAKYKPAKGRGIIELSPAATVGVPGLAGAVEIPESYMKYIVGSINVNPSTGSKSYSIKPEIEGDAKAKAALNWFNQWQDTSIQVNSNPKLRDLLSKAGNDALAIDINPVGTRSDSQFELSVKGNPESKLKVSKEVANQITILQTQTAAANTHDAKFIRLKTEAPKAANMSREDQVKIAEKLLRKTEPKTKTEPPAITPPDQPTPFDEAVTQKQTEKQTQETVAAKKSLENQKTKIENSISELQDKAKILNAVAQKNITTLPEYLKKRMSSYMNATPARNKQDFLDTRKQIEKLKTELDSLKEKILESSK